MSSDAPTKTISAKLRVLISVGVVVVPADQLCKFTVESLLAPWERVEVVADLFYVTHARNPSAAFGLFASVPRDLRQVLLVGTSLAAFIVIAMIFRRLAPGDRAQSLGLSLILWGAAGNLIDRVWRGEVIDFLHVRLWGGYAWPDFNIADICVLVGVAALVLDLLSREAMERALHR